MRPELELNRDHWDEATAFHTRGDVYGLEDFRAGRCRLHRVEVEEVGDVRGKRLLHLQCHFGLDTLSWARRGAIVTGVDFSPAAIAWARRVSAETGVPGEFLCSDVYALADVLPESRTFDVVFTSYGALNWLPDLRAWGRLAARHVAPGGFLYVVEGHPTARMFPMDEDLERAGGFRPWLSYFHDPAGIRWPGDADYADAGARHAVGTHEWFHGMGDVVNALTGAGLVIDWLHEFPFCAWKIVAGCELVERFSDTHGYWGLPATAPRIPLMFSLRASRPA